MNLIRVSDLLMYPNQTPFVNVKDSMQSTDYKRATNLRQPVVAWFHVSANLEQLQRDLLAQLKKRDLVVFHSYPRGPELGGDAVYWDTETHPSHLAFLAAAEAAGAKLITLATQTLTEDVIDEALEHLASTRFDRDDRRAIEIRLKELRRWEGHLCQLELSFSLDRRTYIYEQATEWYDELDEILEQIEHAYGSAQDPSPLGGFYSNN